LGQIELQRIYGMSAKKFSCLAALTMVLVVPWFCCIGCQYAASVALTSTSMGIGYLRGGCAEKTRCVDLDRMHRASVLALEQMGFSISDQSSDEEERKIRAKSEELNVVVALKEVTDRCTRMKVVATKGLAMDKATALQIICQTEQEAERLAPISWPLTRDEIESIADLSPKEAIRQGKTRNAHYVVNGKRYVPMSIEKAQTYRQKGLASWYGNGSLPPEGGYMTASGHIFDQNALSAAHKYLPLSTYVRVTNLANNRSVVVCVNDRGPFTDGRIIDLSVAAARKLGFYRKGTALVVVQTVNLPD